MVSPDGVRDEIRGYVREVASASPHPTKERAIEIAARTLGIPFARAWGIYYGKARQVLAYEADTIRMKMGEFRERRVIALRAELARLEAEHAELTAQLGRSSATGVCQCEDGGDQHAAAAHRAVGGAR